MLDHLSSTRNGMATPPQIHCQVLLEDQMTNCPGSRSILEASRCTVRQRLLTLCSDLGRCVQEVTGGGSRTNISEQPWDAQGSDKVPQASQASKEATSDAGGAPLPTRALPALPLRG